MNPGDDSDLEWLDLTPKAPDAAPLDQVGPQESHAGKKRGAGRFDPNHIWRVYVQCQGHIAHMLQLKDPGLPSSYNGLKKYIKNGNFVEKLRATLAKQQVAEVNSTAAASRKILDNLRDLQARLLDGLLPTKKADGTEQPPVYEPEKFKDAADALLKLNERIDLMSGGVTSRTEVRKVVEVNVRIVCQTFGRVIHEIVQEGALSGKIARQIIDRFDSRIRGQDIVLDSEATTSYPVATVDQEA